MKAAVFLHSSSCGMHCSNAVGEIWEFPGKNKQIVQINTGVYWKAYSSFYLTKDFFLIFPV